MTKLKQIKKCAERWKTLPKQLSCQLNIGEAEWLIERVEKAVGFLRQVMPHTISTEVDDFLKEIEASDD